MNRTSTGLTSVVVGNLKVKLWTVVVVGAAVSPLTGVLSLVPGPDVVVTVVVIAVGVSVAGLDGVVSTALADVLGAFDSVVVRFVGGAIGAALVDLPVESPGSVRDPDGPPLVMVSAGCRDATTGEGGSLGVVS